MTTQGGFAKKHSCLIRRVTRSHPSRERPTVSTRRNSGIVPIGPPRFHRHRRLPPTSQQVRVGPDVIPRRPRPVSSPAASLSLSTLTYAG